MKIHPLSVSEIVISLQVKKLPGGEYLATSRSLPGLVVQGRTMAETLEIAQDVARKLIESYQEHGDPLPPTIRKQIHKKIKNSYLQIPVAVNY